MNAPSNPGTMPDIEKRVDQYVKLRDIIKKLDDEHKAKMEPYRETLETLNGVLLAHLNSIKADSVATSAGTTFKAEKKTASIADGAVFRKFVIDNGLWDLVDWKANAVAVEDYTKEHGTEEGPGPLPPGVNFSRRFEAGVRRASKAKSE